jgi:hypothetical protein
MFPRATRDTKLRLPLISSRVFAAFAMGAIISNCAHQSFPSMLQTMQTDLQQTASASIDLVAVTGDVEAGIDVEHRIENPVSFIAGESLHRRVAVLGIGFKGVPP